MHRRPLCEVCTSKNISRRSTQTIGDMPVCAEHSPVFDSVQPVRDLPDSLLSREEIEARISAVRMGLQRENPRSRGATMARAEIERLNQLLDVLLPSDHADRQ